MCRSRLVKNNVVMAALAANLWGQAFQPAAGSPFTVGPAPNAPVMVAAGDFNNDAKPDLVTANPGNGTFSVLYGDGVGGFALAAGSPVTTPAPTWIVVTDFNRDSKADIATTEVSGGFHLRPGNADGTFGSVLGLGGLSVTFRTAIADFNSDNVPDYVATGAGSYRIVGGSEAGGASVFGLVPVGAGNTYVTTGDFNGDGKADFLLASGSTLFFRRGDGAFGFTDGGSTNAGGTVLGLASGDFNHDGRRDAAVILAGAKVAILLGNGAGGFAAASGSPFNTGLEPSDVAVGDLDNDAHLDLAIAGSGAGGIAILRGNGAGGFSPLTGSPFASPNASSIAIADVDRDGRPDLLAADTPNRAVRVLLNKMSFMFWVPAQIDAFATLGDTQAKVFGGAVYGNGTFFDLNSAPWITAYDGCTGSCLSLNPAGLAAGVHEATTRPGIEGQFSRPLEVRFHITKPAGGIVSDKSLAAPAGVRGAAVGDFNGDGTTDLAVSSPGGLVNVFLGNGAGGFTAAPGGPLSVGSNPEALITADFNRDGRLDIATANTSSHNVSILLGRGDGSFGPLPALTYGVAQQPSAITSGDFNGDGVPDIATSSYSGASVSVLLGNGFGGFIPAPGSPIGGMPMGKSIAVGDFNGDGKIDLVNAADSGYILTGDGTGSFTITAALLLSIGNAVSVMDLNADGKQDLVFAQFATSHLGIFQGLGDGTFSPRQSIPVPSQPEWLAIDDMNGDGIPDIVVSHNGRELTVLKGPAYAADQFPLASYGGGHVVTADFNGDGTRDIAAVDQQTSARVLFSGSPFPAIDLTIQKASITLGESNGFTATATAPTAFDYVTGNIEFTVIPVPGTAAPVAVVQQSNPLRYTASSSHTGIASGTNGVKALYTGNTRFAHSVETFKTFTVAAPVLTLNGTATRSAGVGAAFPGVFSLKVTNQNAQPVAGFQVSFTPAPGANITLQAAGATNLGGGTIAVSTDAQGIASISAVAGNVAGVYGVTAQSRYGTSAAIGYQLTVLPGAAAVLSVQSGSGQLAAVNTAFAQSLQVKVSDSLGNGISGVTVAFAAAASGPSAALSGASAITNASGIAAVTATANGTAGAHSVKASVSGIAAPVNFTLTNLAAGNSTGAPAFVAPANNSTVTTTIVSFQWTTVPGATRYELRLIEANTPQQFRVEVLGSSSNNAIYTLPSGNYRGEIRSCDNAGCSSPGITNFVLAGGSVPAVPPAGLQCSVVNDTNQNRLNCNWTALAGAHFYFVNVVQPNSGPGGGALTVAGQQVGTNSVSVLVPSGQATVVVRGCTGDGCGPFSSGVAINPSIGNPSVPILGEPFAGSSIDAGSNAPQLIFTWNRVAGDNGSNYRYRLYVQDFSRNAAALDVQTTANYYSAFFNPGTRYDALVIAIPVNGGAQQQGPPSPFLTRGRVPKSPVATSPIYGSTVTRDGQGRVNVAWTPLVNSDGTVSTRNYQYFFTGPAQLSGVTTLTSLPLTLAPGSWLGIMRACTTGTSCTASSDTGWGPWNNTAGSEGGMASFTVQ